MVGAVKAGTVVEDADSVQEVGMPSVPTELKSATIAPRTTVEYAQIILKSPLRISNELLNRTSDTFPRTTVEYAQVILKNTLGISEELLDTTRSVAPRVIVEYSSKIAKIPLVFPKELLNDTTPPIITNITVTNITDDSATIKWDTDEFADSLVKYGTSSGAYTKQEYDELFVKNHSVSLYNLSSGTEYYFVVKSVDLSGNSAESSECSFTTLGTPNQPPIASFTYYPENPLLGEQITFDASQSKGTIVKYVWDFGDGNVTNTTEETINHSYSEAGNYEVTLTVTDDDGATNSTTKEITVQPGATIAIADAAAQPSGTTATQIAITNMTNFGAATVTLSYDSNVIQINSVTAGDVGTPTANINNTAGTTTIAAYVSTTTGPDSPITFANIELLAVGSNGETSPLTLVITTLSDADGNSVDAEPISGVFVIGTIKGDLNSDGVLTPADAAIALQIAASGGWDANADMNRDNHITSLDALMILQAAGGNIHGLCT